jgi:hypothetical protein
MLLSLYHRLWALLVLPVKRATKALQDEWIHKGVHFIGKSMRDFPHQKL